MKLQQELQNNCIFWKQIYGFENNFGDRKTML